MTGPAGPAPAGEDASGAALLGARILAVDDEPENLRLLQRLLERAGYTDVTVTTEPAHVPELYRTLQPDLLLMDWHMPGVDGMELLRRLRPHVPRGQYFPVLVISGDMTPGARQDALAVGARDFISKPFNPAEARLRIRNLLETRFLHRQVERQARVLEARVAERTRELEESQAEVLERLAQAAEFRDDDTGEHTRRVGGVAAGIGGALGLDADRVEMLRRAAPLHDLGKIGVPDGILLKPGPLTPEERARMQEHTTIGARILAGGRSPLITLAERIALSHHERWDGAGYPHGLAGEAIPLEARIVAVADFFDALTHDRPYRAAWSEEATLAEIARGAGAHFDPRVVAAFLAQRGFGDAGARGA